MFNLVSEPYSGRSEHTIDGCLSAPTQCETYSNKLHPVAKSNGASHQLFWLETVNWSCDSSSSCNIHGKWWEGTRVNPSFLTWFIKDQLLKSWILSSLSLEVIPQTLGLITSAKVWKALLTAFGAPMEVCQTQLNIRLQSLRKNDMPVTVYQQQMKLIADELAAAGRPVDPGALNVSIFNNLDRVGHHCCIGNPQRWFSWFCRTLKPSCESWDSAKLQQRVWTAKGYCGGQFHELWHRMRQSTWRMRRLVIVDWRKGRKC